MAWWNGAFAIDRLGLKSPLELSKLNSAGTIHSGTAHHKTEVKSYIQIAPVAGNMRRFLCLEGWVSG